MNVVAEERKRLMTKLAMSSIATVHQGLRLASLFVRNHTETRLATPLWIRQPASMKVNMRKISVPLPKVAEKIWFALSAGTVKKAKMVAMLDQPVPQLRNSMLAPIMMPSTWKPDWLSPSGAGMKPVPSIQTTATASAIHLPAETFSDF